LIKNIPLIGILITLVCFILFASGCSRVTVSEPKADTIEKNGYTTYLCGKPDQVRKDLKLEDLSELTAESLRKHALRLGMKINKDKLYGEIGDNCKLPKRPDGLSEFSFTNYTPKGGELALKYAFITYRILHNDAGNIWLIDASYTLDGP